MDIQETDVNFEAHIKQIYPDLPGAWYKRDEKGRYPQGMQQDWELWQAAKANAVPEWISVENTTPNKNGDYIVCIDGEPCSAFFKWVNDHWKEFKVGAGITGGIHGWWHTHLNVTHWMPLPKPPKAQEPAND